MKKLFCFSQILVPIFFLIAIPYSLTFAGVNPIPITNFDIPPFSFKLDGNLVDLSKWNKSSIADVTLDANRIKKTRIYSQDNLKVTCTFIAYKDFPATEWTVWFENIGSSNTGILSEINALDFQRPTGSEEQVTFHYANGSSCTNGSWVGKDYLQHDQGLDVNGTFDLPGNADTRSQDYLPYFNIDWNTKSNGIVGAIGWTAQWRLFTARSSNNINIIAGQQNVNISLAPGEKIRTPLILLVSWTGSDRLVGHNTLRRLLHTHYVPKKSDGKIANFPVLFQDFPVSQADTLVKYGGEGRFTDAVWMATNFPTVGTWVENSNIFPNGIKEWSDEFHKRNASFLLWFEPERVSENSDIYNTHKEYLLPLRYTTPCTVDGYLFDFGNSEARVYMTDLMYNFCITRGIDIVRLDKNLEPYYSYFRGAESPSRIGMMENLYVQGWYLFLDSLKSRMIAAGKTDFMVENSNGKCRGFDIEMVKRSNGSYTPSEAGEVGHSADTNIVQYAGTELYIPGLSSIQLGSFDSKTNWWNLAPSPFQNRAAVHAGRGYFYDCSGATYSEKLKFKKAVEEGLIISSLQHGDYWPLYPAVAPSFTDRSNWVIYEYNNMDIDSGCVVFFRRSANLNPTSPNISLKGIEVNSFYLVNFYYSYDLHHSTLMKGSDLQKNLSVTINSQPGSCLILYNKMKGPVIESTTPSGRCGQGSVTLTASANTGTINWFADSIGGSSLATGSSFKTPSISVTQKYYVEATDGTKASPRMGVLATISSAPPQAPVNISGTQIVCSETAVTISVRGVGILGWYSDSLGGTYLGGGMNYQIPAIGKSTMYYVQDSTCGASVSRTSIQVIVIPTPTINSIISGSRSDAGSVILSAKASKGSKINWYDSYAGSFILFTGDTFMTPKIDSTTTYYVEATAKGPQNLITYSEDFDNAVWTKSNASIIAKTNETVDPLGTNTADKYIEGIFSNGLSILNQSYKISGTVTNSVYLKKGTATWVALSIQGAGYCWFDLQNGLIGSTGGLEPIAKSIENAGNGWFRCSLSYSGTPLGLTIHITPGNGVTSTNGDGTHFVYIWGAQLNEGNEMLTYQKTNNTAINYSESMCNSARIPVIATIDQITEISKTIDAGFDIYPNPGSDLINITVPEYSDIVNIIITDLLGKILLQKNLNAEKNKSFNLSVNSLNVGVYFISVTGNKKYPVRKLMIEK